MSIPAPMPKSSEEGGKSIWFSGVQALWPILLTVIGGCFFVTQTFASLDKRVTIIEQFDVTSTSDRQGLHTQIEQDQALQQQAQAAQTAILANIQLDLQKIKDHLHIDSSP